MACMAPDRFERCDGLGRPSEAQGEHSEGQPPAAPGAKAPGSPPPSSPSRTCSRQSISYPSGASTSARREQAPATRTHAAKARPRVGAPHARPPAPRRAARPVARGRRARRAPPGATTGRRPPGAAPADGREHRARRLALADGCEGMRQRGAERESAISSPGSHAMLQRREGVVAGPGREPRRRGAHWRQPARSADARARRVRRRARRWPMPSQARARRAGAARLRRAVARLVRDRAA